MNLIRFIVARQHMHHQIYTKTVGNLALALAAIAASDGQHRGAVAVDGPSGGPVVTADHNGCHTVIEIAEGHAIYLFCVGVRSLYPDIATVVATGKILQQIECTGHHMIRWKRL